MKEKLFDAVIFDLDGVITKTALVHSVSWKEMFDGYLRFREIKYDEPFREFSHENDYLPFVDGKPRYKGVADFLSSRGINIPFGDPGDEHDKETVCGLGNKKNEVFNHIIARDGVEVYESTLTFIKELKALGYRVGVASSSKNCKPVLEATGLLKYFETRVDGVVSAEIGLKGKPEPDIFKTACDNLGVRYHRSVVVEDAVSGVQAGRKGKFGLVIGVAREENAFELKKGGADIVMEDLSELGGVKGVEEWFRVGLVDDQWSISYSDYDPGNEKSRETLLTVGNGFFATRGSMEEVTSNEINYPGTYMAGLFNRRTSTVGEREIENEDFVNFIHWAGCSFRVDHGEWFSPSTHEFSILERKLDFRTGVLSRKLKVQHADGKESLVSSLRYISMADPHLAGLLYSVTPLNYSGTVEIRTGLDGNLMNEGVERYQDLDQKHLDIVEEGVREDIPYVIVKTNQSNIHVACTSSLEAVQNEKKVNLPFKHEKKKGGVESYISFQADRNNFCGIKKQMAVFNNRDFQTNNPLESCLSTLSRSGNYEEEQSRSIQAWKEIWDEVDVKVEGDRYAQKLLRLHIFHLMVTASPFHTFLDAGIPARGLHGEAYRGHIFWDELYVFPFYVSHFPETAKSVLMYRYRRLPEARKYARQSGHQGAMFPWQSGSSGREETQIVHLNPVSGEWGEDYSSRQRHISIAVAYNTWMYYQISGDIGFMASFGAEMFLDIMRFWASITFKEPGSNKYSIAGVMGPDEFHEKYTGAVEGGLKNNAYTNIMVAWCMGRAFDLLNLITASAKEGIFKRIGLKEEELVVWKEILKGLKLNISEEGIIEQFEGYFDLKELDWVAYKEKYGNIHRLDRILKAEGNHPDAYKAAKQADTLMVFYNLDERIASSVITQLGYNWTDGMLSKNYDYYLQRTSHGSTLSRLVHSRLARQAGHPELCFKMYMEALESDYVDIQGGTTAEGIHVGVMGGTVLSAIGLFAGLNWMSETLELSPFLPDEWQSVEFTFHFRGEEYHMVISKEVVKVVYQSNKNEKGRLIINGKEEILEQDVTNIFSY